MRTVAECYALLRPDCRKARGIIEWWARTRESEEAQALGLDRLFWVLWFRGLRTSRTNRRRLEDKARAQRRRDVALAQFEAGARDLLVLYDAVPGSPEWEAVHHGTKQGDGFTVESRAQHAVRIRAALDPLLRDSTFRSRPPRRPPHRPSTRAGVLAELLKLDFSRDEAREILAALIQ